MNIIKQTSTANTTYAPNRTIIYLAVHYTAGVSSKPGAASGAASWFANPSAGGSADYIVDENTFIQFNPDPRNRYCHAVGGGRYNTKGGRLYGTAKNSNCISLEICSTNTAGKITYPNDPRYSFTDKVLEMAVEAVKYLMELYGIDADHVIRHYDVNGKPCPGIIGWNADSGDESKWEAFHAAIGGKTRPLYRVRLSWKNATSQIGAYSELKNAKKAADQYGYKVFDNNGKCVYKGVSKGTQAVTIHALSDEKTKAAAMLELVHKTDTSGILNSVTTAQMILESGYCSTDLAREANNVFGMKANLSTNTWASVWDGQSTYTKKTQEQDASGRAYYITAAFRKYNCLEDSILDHAAYLLGAMNGSRKRYEGLTETKNYRDAIKLIKKGGYATDVKYVDKICSIVERFGLDKYDPKDVVAGQPQYVVQAGAFSLKKNARKRLRAVKKLGGEFRQAFMDKSGENYLVQAGAFEEKENAVGMAESLKKAGIDACVKVR